jgi:hypothetical protein
MLPCLIKVYIIIDFKINQDDIAKNLCVKKEIENNTCQGSCHLKKELKEAEEQEQKQTPVESLKKIKELQLYSEKFNKYELFGFHIDKQKINSSYHFSFSEDYLSSIFRPPKV